MNADKTELIPSIRVDLRSSAVELISCVLPNPADLRSRRYTDTLFNLTFAFCNLHFAIIVLRSALISYPPIQLFLSGLASAVAAGDFFDAPGQLLDPRRTRNFRNRVAQSPTWRRLVLSQRAIARFCMNCNVPPVLQAGAGAAASLLPSRALMAGGKV